MTSTDIIYISIYFSDLTKVSQSIPYSDRDWAIHEGEREAAGMTNGRANRTTTESNPMPLIH
jgi:hypothetical protein